MSKSKRFLIFLQNYPMPTFDENNKMNFCKGLKYSIDAEDENFYYHYYDNLQPFKFSKQNEGHIYITGEIKRPKIIK